MQQPTDQNPSDHDAADGQRSSDTRKEAAPKKTGDSTPRSVIVRQHSLILYWWPVWVLGFVFAALSFVWGERVEVGGQQMWFHPSRYLGVIYVAVLAVVFIRTNLVLRGVVSLLVVLSMIVGVLTFSLLGWWHGILSLEEQLSIHMDAGFYLALSSIIFLSWIVTVLLIDRVTYCEFRPGQLIVHKVIGGGVRTFDTRGISVYKLQDDLFRHWGLGMGTGDLHIATTGAEGVTLDLRNVTFIDRKLAMIERLIAMSPDEATER